MSLTHHGSGRFDVWAPDASAVSLLANGHQYPMKQVAESPAQMAGGARRMHRLTRT